MTKRAPEQGLTDVLEQLVDGTQGEEVSFGDVLGVFGQRAFGPILLVPAIIAVAPTGAIPGMSILTGSIIAIVSAQLLFMRERPWLPNKLLRFSFSREKLVGTVAYLRPYTDRIDRIIQPRLGFATDAPFVQGVALLTFALGLSMYPLALLPFAVAVPGTSVALLALGLTARDGLFVLLGVGFVAASSVIAGLLLNGAISLGLSHAF